MKVIPLTEARARLLELVRDAESEDILIARHGRPVAVLTTPDHLESLRDQIEELEDQLSVYQARENDPGMRIPLDKVKAELGMVS